MTKRHRRLLELVELVKVELVRDAPASRSPGSGTRFHESKHRRHKISPRFVENHSSLAKTLQLYIHVAINAHDTTYSPTVPFSPDPFDARFSFPFGCGLAALGFSWFQKPTTKEWKDTKRILTRVPRTTNVQNLRAVRKFSWIA